MRYCNLMMFIFDSIVQDKIPREKIAIVLVVDEGVVDIAETE
jgi:hypothetical protein